jgi:hypothetical protein
MAAGRKLAAAAKLGLVSELPRWWLFMLIAIILCVIASGIITVIKL